MQKKFGNRIGSPQISQCRTSPQLRAAAAAKSAKSPSSSGGKFGVRPPFAQPGVRISVSAP